MRQSVKMLLTRRVLYIRILCLAHPNTSKQTNPTIAENHSLQDSVQGVLAEQKTASRARLKDV